MTTQQQINNLFMDNPKHIFTMAELNRLFRCVSYGTISKSLTRSVASGAIISISRGKWRLTE